MRFDHRHRDLRRLEILVAPPERTPILRTRALEHPQVVRVIHDAHQIGVAEDHAVLVDHPTILITRAGSRTTGSASISASAARTSPSRASCVTTTTDTGSATASCTTCAMDTWCAPRIVINLPSTPGASITPNRR